MVKPPAGTSLLNWYVIVTFYAGMWLSTGKDEQEAISKFEQWNYEKVEEVYLASAEQVYRLTEENRTRFHGSY